MGTHGPDPFELSRFLQAQDGSYAQALSELRAGRKRSHWIWFVFPQVLGLGSSAMSVRYAIRSLDEAKAYLDHPVLGERLRQCVAAMCSHTGLAAVDILGGIDARKFHSCLTLFSLADPTERCFGEALDRYFSGERDAATLALVSLS